MNCTFKHGFYKPDKHIYDYMHVYFFSCYLLLKCLKNEIVPFGKTKYNKTFHA